MTDKSLPAFPQSQEIYGGLSTRQLFAAMAMQGLIGSDRVSPEHSPVWPDSVVAARAVAMADALIAELNKTEEA